MPARRGGLGLAQWSAFAFIGWDATFPMAPPLAAILRNGLPKAGIATGDVLLPALVSTPLPAKCFTPPIAPALVKPPKEALAV